MKEVKKFRFIPIVLAVILAVFLLLASVTTVPAASTGTIDRGVSTVTTAVVTASATSVSPTRSVAIATRAATSRLSPR